MFAFLISTLQFQRAAGLGTGRCVVTVECDQE
jgi:hypothetical protein